MKPKLKDGGVARVTYKLGVLGRSAADIKIKMRSRDLITLNVSKWTFQKIQSVGVALIL